MSEGSLDEYLAWLEARRYTSGTIRGWMRIARRVQRTFPDGVPEDQYVVAAAVVPGSLPSTSRHSERTGVYRYCEFLSHRQEAV